jgi:hypothetical protein
MIVEPAAVVASSVIREQLTRPLAPRWIDEIDDLSDLLVQAVVS